MRQTGKGPLALAPKFNLKAGAILSDRPTTSKRDEGVS